ncbi:CBS-domain-containing protein [Mycena kentingensis (nom. inval.)]|nr:CBS-domain-containing protein [Mycena kentingensis (nom. inval.)]
MPLTDKKGTKRPEPLRSSSFKRHASFDTAPEVPRPSAPTAPATIRGSPDPHMPVFDDESDWEMIQPGGAKLHKPRHHQQIPAAHPDASPPPPSAFPSKPSKLKSYQPPPPSFQQGGSILPYARPYSLPEAHSYRKSDATSSPGVDRTSSASLPLPMQVPFSTLPRAGQKPQLPSPVYERSATESSLRPSITSSSSSSSSGSGSLPSAPGSRSRSPRPDDGDAESRSYPQTKRGPAPMPPAETTTSHGGVAFYRPPRTTYTPVPAPVPETTTTAITRTPSNGTAVSLPPPEPPVILPGAETDGDAGLLADGATVGSRNLRRSLPGDEGSNSRLSKASSRSSGASYEPFLSHAPPPVDSWIEVESTPIEYRLIVRLPGFKRDGITLATKKRRILHLVADSWEAGGGHFERRISFGYDADLAQVRAEFDGELLRVIIPRRMPAGMSGATSNGGVGATSMGMSELQNALGGR